MCGGFARKPLGNGKLVNLPSEDKLPIGIEAIGGILGVVFQKLFRGADGTYPLDKG